NLISGVLYQMYFAGREVSGQERSGPADEVHLQRLREALRQQQRHPAPVARKGRSWNKETRCLWCLFFISHVYYCLLTQAFAVGGLGSIVRVLTARKSV
uniref:Uncharacterized protein n=1 Tax=Sinocyclocheilus grahami TaxID=75366 RepID=A0A672K9N0_SINGR